MCATGGQFRIPRVVNLFAPNKIDPRAYTELSPRENKVYVYTSKPTEAKAALLTIGAIPDFVEIKSGGWYVSSDAAMMGGGAISATSGSCAAAFRFRGQSLTGDSDLDSRLSFGGSLGRADRCYGRRMGSDRAASAA